MDYTLFDAMQAGCREVVFVVRPELEDRFHASIGRRLAGRLPVTYVHQRMDDLPAGYTVPVGRSKPWGTAQAVLSLAAVVRAPFAVVNADDYYGPETFHELGRFFGQLESVAESRSSPVPTEVPPVTPTFAMVGYRLGDTLSAAGSVSRGVCRGDDDGWLQQIDEILALEKRGDDGWYRDEAGHEHLVRGDTLVSRNCWGFTPQVFPLLRDGFVAFLEEVAPVANDAARATSGTDLSVSVEYLLPNVIGNWIKHGQARVKILPGGKLTFGMTYQQDSSAVREQIATLIAAGRYPERLWS
jgi:hypothetical protein